MPAKNAKHFVRNFHLAAIARNFMDTFVHLPHVSSLYVKKASGQTK
jgi:hypothetical protein